MAKKVLLITPPYHSGVVEAAGKWPNLGFLYIAAELLKDGHDVEIYDAMAKDHTYEDIEKRIKDTKPDIVGSTAYTATINAATQTLRLAKSINQEITTIIGGIHPTMMPEDTLTQGKGAIDYIVRYEGELTTPELIRAIESELEMSQVNGIAYWDDDHIVITPPRDLIEDLDILSPAWELVDWNDYYLCYFDNSKLAILSSSRGCSNECAFCSQHHFWQKTYRERSAENFVWEIEHLKHRCGVNCFFIGDEYPTKERKRWERILDLLIEKDLNVYLLLETCATDIIRDRDILNKYRQAGVIHMFLGVEAAVQETLDKFKKEQTCQDCKNAIELLNNHGIITECSFIVGLPEETEESISKTFELASYYNADNPHFLMITPWPYADMYQELKPFIEDHDFSNYNYVTPVIKPKHMSLKDLRRITLQFYKQYYMEKLPQWDALEDEFKKTCLFRGLQAIMQNSFLKKHMSSEGGAEMPAKIKKLMMGNLEQDTIPMAREEKANVR